MLEFIVYVMAFTGVLVWLFVLFVVLCIIFKQEVNIQFTRNTPDKETDDDESSKEV